MCMSLRHDRDFLAFPGPHWTTSSGPSGAVPQTFPGPQEGLQICVWLFEFEAGAAPACATLKLGVDRCGGWGTLGILLKAAIPAIPASRCRYLAPQIDDMLADRAPGARECRRKRADLVQGHAIVTLRDATLLPCHEHGMCNWIRNATKDIMNKTKDVLVTVRVGPTPK
ncbi:hypothetical protein B0H12DRAFT_1074762 [Mycena haematopus]|nr:hypothetical protein B0H12DRAFT_1074762 [Mycena haematopus]